MNKEPDELFKEESEWRDYIAILEENLLDKDEDELPYLDEFYDDAHNDDFY